MEVDSSVPRVQLLGRFILIFVLLVVGCSDISEQHHSNRKVNAIDVKTSFVEGKFCIDGIPFTGTLYQLDENNMDTASVSHYIDGLEDGEWRKFYPNGKMKEQRFYKNGKKVGIMKAWWENGKLQMLFNFENDEYEGVCSEWNDQGVMVREQHYHLGHEEGSQRQWYDNGKVRSNYVMKNGRRYGLLGTKNCVNVKDSISLY